jgi:hypothetical protein
MSPLISTDTNHFWKSWWSFFVQLRISLVYTDASFLLLFFFSDRLCVHHVYKVTTFRSSLVVEFFPAIEYSYNNRGWTIYLFNKIKSFFLERYEYYSKRY